MALLSAGVILILQTRIGRKRGVNSNTQMDLTNVHKILEILRFKVRYALCFTPADLHINVTTAL